MLHTERAGDLPPSDFQGSKTRQIAEQALAEVYRRANETEAQVIRLEKVIVAPKLSKLEYDMLRLGLGESEVLKRYEAEGAPLARILSSHEAQHQALQALHKVFSPEQFLARHQVTRDALRAADLVIAFGGDNHFQYVSHAIEDGYILGVNADPLRSEGALVQYTSEELMEILSALTRGDFEISEWTRLDGEVDGRPMPRIMCEYFLGERDRMEMSRYTVRHRSSVEEQKGSGLVISTGAGSTGWYDSEIADYLGRSDVFPRTRSEARLFVTAPFRGRLTDPKLRHQALLPGESLSIASFNDADGIVGCDALERIPFPRGALARIQLSEHPLKVLRARV